MKGRARMTTYHYESVAASGVFNSQFFWAEIHTLNSGFRKSLTTVAGWLLKRK